MYLNKPYIEHFELGDGFGDRIHPITGLKSFHKGQDVPMPIGTKIIAPISGTVAHFEDPVTETKKTGYGHFIILSATTEQGSKIQLWFAHLSKILIKDNEKVLQNQEIALSGQSGGVTGPHLHFEVRLFDGQSYVPVDPVNYINFA